MVVLCFSHYGESVDVTFLIVVCILTKLLAFKVNQVSDPETYLEQLWRKRRSLSLCRDGCSVNRRCVSREDSTLIG